MNDTAWRCIGCGNEANLAGETGCKCPSGLLFRPSDMTTVPKVRLIDEQIAQQEQRLIDLRAERVAVIDRIRSGRST